MRLLRGGERTLRVLERRPLINLISLRLWKFLRVTGESMTYDRFTFAVGLVDLLAWIKGRHSCLQLGTMQWAGKCTRSFSPKVARPASKSNGQKRFERAQPRTEVLERQCFLGGRWYDYGKHWVGP